MRGSGRTTDALQRSWAMAKSGRHVVYMCINSQSQQHTFYLATRLFPEATVLPGTWDLRYGVTGLLRISIPPRHFGPSDFMRSCNAHVEKDHVIEEGGWITQELVCWVDEWNRITDR